MTEPLLLPDEEAIVAGLGERGLPEWGALVVAPQIVALSSPLREAFLFWWQMGNVPDVSVQEQSARSLVASGLHPLAVLLSLDALERNPVAVGAQLRLGQEKFTPIEFDATFPNPAGENL